MTEKFNVYNAFLTIIFITFHKKNSLFPTEVFAHSFQFLIAGYFTTLSTIFESAFIIVLLLEGICET